MKEITIDAFKKLPKRGPYSGSSLKPGTMYYIHDTRNSSNPVYIGTYVGPVNYYGEHATMVNYKFENVKYLVKPSNYRNEPGTTFGNVHKYYEVPLEPTSTDIKHKKTTIKELKSFINEKKAEPHDTPPNISFMGKDYRKVRDKFYNKSRSSSSTKRSNHSKRSTPTITASSSSSSSSSRKRSNKTSSRRSSSSRTPSSSPRTPSSYSSRTSSSFRRRTRRTSRR
jgi:hypothetical protein